MAVRAPAPNRCRRPRRPGAGAGAGAGAPDVRARLVQEDQLRRRDAGDRRPPRGPLPRVLLGGVELLFLRVHPSRAMARCMVATLTRMPWSAAHRSQCSAKVASGVASTCACRAAAWAGPIRAARPGNGRGASEPRRRWATYRWTVARPTPDAERLGDGRLCRARGHRPHDPLPQIEGVGSHRPSLRPASDSPRSALVDLEPGDHAKCAQARRRVGGGTPDGASSGGGWRRQGAIERGQLSPGRRRAYV